MRFYYIMKGASHVVERCYVACMRDFCTGTNARLCHVPCANAPTEVRRTCLRMLSHLIVSSIIKPRGKMACVARCLVAYEEDGSGKGCAAGASEAQQPEQGGVRGVQGEAQGSQGQGRADGELAGEQSGQEGDEDLEEEEEDEEEEYGAKPKGKRGRKPKGRKSKGQSDKGQQKDGGSGGAKAEAKARAARGVAGGGADVGSLEGGSLRSMALCLFNTLASKQMKGGGNLVNQYLPEIIAQLVADGDLSEDDFRSIMTVRLAWGAVAGEQQSVAVQATAQLAFYHTAFAAATVWPY